MFDDVQVEVSFVDFTNVGAVEAACQANTKMIFSESPTNP